MRVQLWLGVPSRSGACVYLVAGCNRNSSSSMRDRTAIEEEEEEEDDLVGCA